MAMKAMSQESPPPQTDRRHVHLSQLKLVFSRHTLIKFLISSQLQTFVVLRSRERPFLCHISLPKLLRQFIPSMFVGT